MYRTFICISWLALALSLPSDGARVLILVESMNSHVLQFSRLGLELATLGHDVRVLAAASVRVPDFVRQLKHGDDNDNNDDDDDGTEVIRGLSATTSTQVTPSGGTFNYTTFAVDDQTPYVNSLEYSNFLTEYALTKSTLKRMILISSIMRAVKSQFTRDNRKVIENREVMNELRRDNYEFVIVDPGSTLHVVPLSLGVPYGMMSLSVFPSWYYRVPRLPSYAVLISLELTDRMTFAQRLFNLVNELNAMLIFSMLDHQLEIISITDDQKASSSRMMSYTEAFQQASLWMIVADPIVSYALPDMPNSILVGDLMAGREGSPLPPDLERFVSASTNGVVIVSFGSYLDNLPADVIAKLCDAFSRLGPGRRVVWKLKYADSCSDLEHVKTVSWLPQNDLLADQRVKLFITHGGLNSMMEAVYHAKPMLVFPLFVDQPTNAAAAVAKGYAIRMDLGDFTSESLLENIETMMSDRKYELSARHWSSILRDRRSTPAERVSDMIEQVIKYGDGHLRTGAFDLNVLQFWMFDLFAVICSFVLINIAIGCFIVRWAIHKCFKGRAAGALGKQKSD